MSDGKIRIEAESYNLEEIEKAAITQCLAQLTKGNMTHAAKELGLDRRTLYRKIERFGLRPLLDQLKVKPA